jgi:hypothetical protein
MIWRGRRSKARCSVVFLRSLITLFSSAAPERDTGRDIIGVAAQQIVGRERREREVKAKGKR